MNVPPTCDWTHPEGPADAHFVVIDKTTGKIKHSCSNHLAYLDRDHSYSIFPAKDYSKPKE